MENDLNFCNYDKHANFSQSNENAAKISSQGDTAKTTETPENNGLTAAPAIPTSAQLGGKHKSLKKTATKNPIEAAQHHHRQHHKAILRRPVGAAKADWQFPKLFRQWPCDVL